MKRSARASRACLWCQNRKVRCDGAITGPPCTRCKQHGEVCRFSERRRRRHSTLLIDQPGAASSSSASSAGQHGGGYDANLPLHLSSGVLPFLTHHLHYSKLHFLELQALSALRGSDVTHLSDQGCLSIPSPDPMHEFITQYFIHVHPSAIMIDEAAFWKTYTSKQDENIVKIPLILFQALLFASAPYVSKHTLLKCGFTNRRTALNVLYNRARLLYDLGTESRPRYLAQTAFLLTLFTPATEPHAANKWLARSVQNLIVADSSGDSSTSKAGKDTTELSPWKKRLWWSIIIRDRSLSLGLRRQPQITQKELRLAAPAIQEGELMEEIRESRVYDLPTKRAQIRIFQEQCQLAVLLTDMVAMRFSSINHGEFSFSEKELSSRLHIIKSTKTALAQWMASSRLPSILEDKPHSAVEHMIQTTFMYYHTACIDLAHYESLLLVKNPSFAGSTYSRKVADTGHTLYKSMVELIGIMEYFSRERESPRLTISMLAYLEIPMIIGAIDLKMSPSWAELETRRRRMEAMGKLHNACGQTFEIADNMGRNTNHLLRLAYDFTRSLFLRSDVKSPTKEASTSQLQIRPTRSSTWADAFLRYPHAYLIITASVDYYLSAGKLPTTGCLPEFPHDCVLPIGLSMVYELEPPWSAELNNRRLEAAPKLQAPTSSVQDSELQQQSQSQSQSQSSSLVCRDVPVPEFGDFTTGQLVPSKQRRAVILPKIQNNLQDTATEKSKMNLNYLPLDEEPPNSPPTTGPVSYTHLLESADRSQETIAALNENDLWSFMGIPPV